MSVFISSSFLGQHSYLEPRTFRSPVETTDHIEESSPANFGNESVPSRPLVYVGFGFDHSKSCFGEEIPDTHRTPAIEVTVAIIWLIAVRNGLARDNKHDCSSDS